MMGVFSEIMDHFFGPKIERVVDLGQVSQLRTLDGLWMFEKVRYEEHRPGLKWGVIELSPIRVTGYGYRVMASPRPVHSSYSHIRKPDLQFAIDQAQLGMKVADRLRMESTGLFR